MAKPLRPQAAKVIEDGIGEGLSDADLKVVVFQKESAGFLILAVEDAAGRREAIAAVVARFPRFLDGWARLGQHARDDVEAYACFRVGYHRGLDALRQAGWRGSGYVRAAHPENLGFLRALDGLRRQAGRIGELDEEGRCAEFLHQLDPAWAGEEGSA